MTQSKEQTREVVEAVDWEAAEIVAGALGRMARDRVQRRDAGTVRDWSLQMARAHTGEGNALRSMSYFELAVIAGHRPREVEEGREWRELLQEAQALAALVRVKAEEDEAARAAAKREAAKARAEAELAMTPEDPEADQPEPKAGETSPQEAA